RPSRALGRDHGQGDRRLRPRGARVRARGAATGRLAHGRAGSGAEAHEHRGRRLVPRRRASPRVDDARDPGRVGRSLVAHDRGRRERRADRRGAFARGALTVRGALAEKGFGAEKGFRWRGHDVSRIENLSDSVCGSSLTLLVVSLEVPATFGALVDVIRGFAAFAVCFTLLLVLWHSHYVFFRRYGLNDEFTIIANSVLLFLVLFYVYPLKFIFTYLIGVLCTSVGLFGEDARGAYLQKLKAMVTDENAVPLMVIYGAGFLAVSLVFAWLYLHAWKKREELELDPVETLMTVEEMQGHLIDGGIAVISITIALLGAPALAGWSYFLIGPARAAHGITMRKRRVALEPHVPSETAYRRARHDLTASA